MTQTQKSRLMLAATLLMFAAVGWLFWKGEQRVFANHGRLEVREAGAYAVVLSWSSGVRVPMARRFEEAYLEWRDRKDVFIIELHSPGGALAEGKLVIDVINRMKRTHRVETVVRANKTCASMCVPIYLQGEVRQASRSSRFMFHEPTAYDFVTGEKANQPEAVRRQEADRFFRRYFESSDMTPAFQAQLRRDWVGRDVWKTGAELVSEESGIVTELR